MDKVSRFASRLVVLARDNVDTDQIIPARFLTTTGRSRLGEGLFADWRYGEDGAPRPEFPLNQPEARGAAILLAGRNFGCGSSREHAVWALQACGIRAVISTEFADIFRSNALGNGLLPIQLAAHAWERVLQLREGAAQLELEVDLESQTLAAPDGERFAFPVDRFARHCLLNGTDALGYLLAARDEITRYEMVRTGALVEA